MKLDTGAVINGFTVDRARHSEELGGDFYELTHIKTRASLCWLDNGCDNKLFCVGFKTLPEDSTGVFHILEHSVLCGSDKYPVKEPFVDLMKSSMNTFLNAMTFSDKTIYPVSSRNEQDYMNLVSVYLDAVFAPRSVKDPNAFLQEGWHLELDADGRPYINGVVYNEMKGATSGVDDILEEGMTALLFPDNCYGFNSGGDPAAIPDLTFADYRRMYHKYYSPSNARFFLDGSVPLERTLALVDAYISGGERQSAEHVIPMQEPKPARRTEYYEIAPDENEEGRAMLSYGKILGTFRDKRKLMMAEVLCSLLDDTNDAPLKRAILDAGLGEDLELTVVDGIEQPILVMTVRSTKAENADRIREKTEEVVAGLLEAGLDRRALTAQLNRYAFRIKDMREPAGLIRCIMSYQSSLYGGDPLLYLENSGDIAAMRRAIDEGGFDALLREMFDFGSMSLLTVLPSKTHGEKLRREEAERAERIYAAMDAAARSELKAQNERLHAWQEAPDSPEDTALLPVLPLDEVSPEPILVPTDELSENGVRVLYHAVPSNGIVHLNLYFSAADAALDDMPALGFMTALFSKLPTKAHGVPELQTLIKTYIGRLRFSVDAANAGGRACKPFFTVSCDVLEENLEKACELIAEMLRTTRFDDLKKIREIAAQTDEQFKQNVVMSGHAVGIAAVMAQYFAANAVQEAVSGVTFHRFIKGLLASEDAISGFAASASGFAERAFVRSRLTAGVTNTAPITLAGLLNALPEGAAIPAEAEYAARLPKKLGIRIPAQVSFAETGMAVPRVTGSMKVAANIIGLGFLWNRVRVQGGAYGVGLRAMDRGAVVHYTYRDPSPARSLGVFAEESAFIKEFCSGSEKLDKYVISTVGDTEPLRTPAEMGREADLDAFEGRTPDDARRLRREILETTPADLAAFCEALDKCAAEGAVCVVGAEQALSTVEGITIIDA